MNDWITTKQMPWLERYLDFAAQRQRLVSDNLANIDTPGFVTQDINFESAMQRALDDNQIAELPFDQVSKPNPEPVAGLVSRPDGNNVSIDRESALLAETQIRFQLG